MELNLLEEKIALNRTIFDQTLEQPLDTEFTLPDYFPEIERILKCCINPGVNSKIQNGSSVCIDGTAFITLVYSDNEGNIFGYDHQLPFSKTVDVTAEGGTPMNITCSAATDYVGCRALSSRKISIHATAALKLCVTALRISSALADIDDSTVQTLRESRMATMPIGCVEKQFTIEEEVMLDSVRKNVSVICAFGDTVCNECKLINNKAVIKGRLTACGIYRSSSGIDRFNAELPLSQIVDVEGVNDTCSCLAEFSLISLELRPKNSGGGDIHAFILSARVGIKISAFCSREVSLLSDAFSTKFECKQEKNELPLERMVKTVDDTIICKKNLEFADNDFAEVLDVWCSLGRENVQREQGMLIISGELTLIVLAKDSSGMAVCFDRSAEYEYRLTLPEEREQIKCMTAIHLEGYSFDHQGGTSIEFKAEIRVSASVSVVENLLVLSGLSICEDKPKETLPSSVVICFAKAGDRIWEIAKSYNTSPDEIMQVNEISGDRLQSDKPLLIPCLY